MNHDYSHCLDFNDSCPKKCFRAELVRDLRSRKDMVGVPISWTHCKGTDECPKVERIETIESHIRNGKGEWAWECTTGELIRCKDCKYNNGGRCSWHGGAGYKWIVDDDDFCSIAERKDVYVTLHHDDIHFKDEESEKAFYNALAERKE